MSENIIKGVVINDIHFGIRESKRLYDELNAVFKKYILDHKDELEIIIIDGDYFDCKVSLTEIASLYAISFFKDIFYIAKENGISLRMVQGTRSHDLNQLQLFKPFTEDLDADFKIIETVTEENLRGLKVLYLPEEYPESSEEYYKDYKDDSKVYNIIFGHGTWDFVAQPGVLENSQRETHSAPVFMWKEWKHTVPNGFISFGHIHGRNTYGKKIFYSGSFTRWNYGERSARGFTKFEYNLDSEKYIVSYIDNDIAPKYDVISVKELGVDLSAASVETLQTMLDEQITNTDNLKIDLSGLTTENTEILKKYYANNPKVKIEIKEKKVILKESTHDPSLDKFNYIIKKEVPIDEMIVRFAKEELDRTVTVEEVRKVIGGENENK